MLAFGGHEADAVDDWSERQVGGNALQPVRHQVTWEEGAGEEHHGENDDVAERRGLALVFCPTTDSQTDAEDDGNAKYQEQRDLEVITENFEVEDG